MFGSLAWGTGALIVGYLIDFWGMDSIFFFTYPFFLISFIMVITYLPSSEPRIIISKSQSRGELDLSISDDMDGSSHSTASWHGLKDAESAARYAMNSATTTTTTTTNSSASSSDSDEGRDNDNYTYYDNDRGHENDNNNVSYGIGILISIYSHIHTYVHRYIYTFIHSYSSRRLHKRY